MAAIKLQIIITLITESINLFQYFEMNCFKNQRLQKRTKKKKIKTQMQDSLFLPMMPHPSSLLFL